MYARINKVLKFKKKGVKKMAKKETFLLGFLTLVLIISLLVSCLFTRTVNADSNDFPNIALSAGNDGTVYFYDGVNLFFSSNYGNEWKKVK